MRKEVDQQREINTLKTKDFFAHQFTHLVKDSSVLEAFLEPKPPFRMILEKGGQVSFS